MGLQQNPRRGTHPPLPEPTGSAQGPPASGPLHTLLPGLGGLPSPLTLHGQVLLGLQAQSHSLPRDHLASLCRLRVTPLPPPLTLSFRDYPPPVSAPRHCLASEIATLDLPPLSKPGVPLPPPPVPVGSQPCLPSPSAHREAPAGCCPFPASRSPTPSHPQLGNYRWGKVHSGAR